MQYLVFNGVGWLSAVTTTIHRDDGLCVCGVRQGGVSMVQTDIMTLTRFMIDHTRANPDQADLESLMASIQVGRTCATPLPSGRLIARCTNKHIAAMAIMAVKPPAGPPRVGGLMTEDPCLRTWALYGRVRRRV
jgi:hypothetical protein